MSEKGNISTIEFIYVCTLTQKGRQLILNCGKRHPASVEKHLRALAYELFKLIEQSCVERGFPLT